MLQKGTAKKVTIFVNEDTQHHFGSLCDSILTFRRSLPAIVSTRIVGGEIAGFWLSIGPRRFVVRGRVVAKVRLWNGRDPILAGKKSGKTIFALVIRCDGVH